MNGNYYLKNNLYLCDENLQHLKDTYEKILFYSDGNVYCLFTCGSNGRQKKRT